MPPATQAIKLNKNEVHLWMLNPKQILGSSTIRSLLSTSECEKVDRYRSASAQHTALITRAFIRLLLSQYASFSPQTWRFSIGEMGKPEIADNTFGLRFNLSHNDELIICAICLNNEVGCDIENLSRKISVNAIAKRFFSEREAQLIEAEPTRFFEYWTLKEAFVKATGLGISQGLETFSFQVNTSKVKDFNDNIELTFNADCKQASPKNCYQALLFPDDKHCIGLSYHNQKQVDVKPNIHLFSVEQSKALFNV